MNRDDHGNVVPDTAGEAQELHTTEIGVLNLKHRNANVFAHKGDSGGMVYLMATGQLVGTLFRGNSTADDDDLIEVSYVTKGEELDKAVRMREVGGVSTWA